MTTFLENPSKLVRFLRTEDFDSNLYCLISLLTSNKKYKEIENIVFTTIYYSINLSINYKFLTNLLTFNWNKENVLFFLHLKDSFKLKEDEKRDFADDLIQLIDSMFKKENLCLWFWIKVIFLSFLINVDMKFKNEQE